jgi:hypothetical protein
MGTDLEDAFERYLHSSQQLLPPGEYVCDSLQHDKEGSLLLNGRDIFDQPANSLIKETCDG